MKKILVPIDGSENSRRALIEAKKWGESFKAKVVILNVVDGTSVHLYRDPYRAKDKDLEHYLADEYGMKKTIKGSTDLEEELLEATFINEAVVDSGKKLLEEELLLFQGFPGEVETKLRRGNPSKEIIKEIDENDYDLVVIGSRGLGAFSRVLLGSVSNKVVNHVDINVLIVK